MVSWSDDVFLPDRRTPLLTVRMQTGVAVRVLVQWTYDTGMLHNPAPPALLDQLPPSSQIIWPRLKHATLGLTIAFPGVQSSTRLPAKAYQRRHILGASRESAKREAERRTIYGSQPDTVYTLSANMIQAGALRRRGTSAVRSRQLQRQKRAPPR